MRPTGGDYIYIFVSAAAGVWEAWTFTSSRGTLWIMFVAMGLPFALASYAHSEWSRRGPVNEHPAWMQILVLWAGMPGCLALGALVIAAETGGLYAVGFGKENLPLYSVRLLIGEAVSCLAWAWALMWWSRRHRNGPSNKYLRGTCAVLFAGVLLGHGLAMLPPLAHKDFYLISVFVTAVSALALVNAESKTPEPLG